MPRRKRTTEYDTRQIDEFGDAIDVNSFDTLKEAEDTVARCYKDNPEIVAWTIEKHEYTWDENEGWLANDKYTMLASGGSREALKAGGWIEE